MKERVKIWIFWALMFVGAVLVLSQRGYSDGDDAFFYQYAQEMGLAEYLSWRYETWVGRMGGEAMVWLTFRLGIWFWRVVNALMLVLLPAGILRLAGWTAEKTDCARGAYYKAGLPAAVAAVAGYVLMDAMTLGYAAVWVNGSVFYTWSFTCGIWALVPFAELVFAEAGRGVPGEVAGTGEPAGDTETRGRKLRFLYSIPCAVIAAMSVEQMGAVLLVFEVLAVLYLAVKRRRLYLLPTVQAAVTAAAFAALFLAPGNELRVASEIAHWMPEYETMELGQHLFITVHWMLSSFANENKLFLCVIWIAGAVLLVQRLCRERHCADNVSAGRRICPLDVMGEGPADAAGYQMHASDVVEEGSVDAAGYQMHASDVVEEESETAVVERMRSSDVAEEGSETAVVERMRTSDVVEEGSETAVVERMRTSDVVEEGSETAVVECVQSAECPAGNERPVRMSAEKKCARAVNRICVGLAGMFTVAALLPYAGITRLSDLGMQYIGIASRIEMVPSLASMDGNRLSAMAWWTVALAFTLVLIWRVADRWIVPVLAYLAGLASEAILFFSPTMYASGARVYYLTDLLYLFVFLTLSFRIRNKAVRNAVYGVVLLLGVINLAAQAGNFMSWMQKS